MTPTVISASVDSDRSPAPEALPDRFLGVAVSNQLEAGHRHHRREGCEQFIE